jgi:hypothetical protein
MSIRPNEFVWYLTLLFSAQAVKSRHINLVDLVYHADKARTFPSIKELASYSIRHKKVFPKESAKAGGILRFLLRPIFTRHGGP